MLGAIGSTIFSLWLGGVGELVIVLSVYLGLPSVCYGVYYVRAKRRGSTDAEVANAASIQLAVDGGGAPSTASMSRGEADRVSVLAGQTTTDHV